MIYTINQIRTLNLTLIIVFSVLFGIGLILLVYFLIIRNKRLSSHIRELAHRYESLHTTLCIEDAQYLKRIEYISQVNLLYGTIHEKYTNIFNDLKNNKDTFASEKVNELKRLIEDKRFKFARQQLGEIKPFINEFEKEVYQLHNELLEIIKPEEECNRLLNDARENFKLIKQDYESHILSLGLLKKTYEAVFKYVEQQFKDYEQLVEVASYDEAKKLLPKMQKILGELNEVNKVMPNLCVMVTKTVPQRITDLESEYKRMDKEGYPVQHIVTPQMITTLRDDCRLVAKNLKNFYYKTANDDLGKIMVQVNACFEDFKKEKNDRMLFEKEYAPIYTNINHIEKEFIKLCNSIPKIKTFYIINDDQVTIRNSIQSHINRIGISKRSLDNSVHNSIRQPYSLLLKKTEDLKNEAAEIENEMGAFRNYLMSLKDDVERAHNLISEFYYRIRKAEKTIRDSSIKSFADKYEAKIDEVYKYLETINTSVSTLPIDVMQVNNAVNFIVYQGESLLNQIEQDNNMLRLAESSLLYLNQNRDRFPDLNQGYLASEKLFFNAEFEKSYNASTEIIKRYNEMEA